MRPTLSSAFPRAATVDPRRSRPRHDVLLTIGWCKSRMANNTGRAIAAMVLVLVVDDDSAICELVGLLLEDDGHEVVVCSDGSQAYPLVCELRPALVVLDLLLRDLSGKEVLALIKGDRRTMYIPILVSSASTIAIQQLPACLLRECVDILLKPFDIDELTRKVDGLLNHACNVAV